MEQNNANSFLVKETIGKLMGKFAIPCIISLLVGSLYNIIDQIFIANASYLGSYGNAANTVVFPLTIVALAIAVMIGDGCCAFVSINLGKGDKEAAHKSIGNAVVLTVLASIVLVLIYFIFFDDILALFGGTINEQTLALSREYFFYITLGIPFYMIGQSLNPIIRSDGNPRYAMIATLIGAVINIFLDPIFIFVFHWGMMGAAVATVIGQVATFALSCKYLFGMKNVKLVKESFKLNLKLISKFIVLGLCSFLSQISLVAAMAAVNSMVQKYGALDTIFGQIEYAQIPMAVVGIVMKVFQIIISIVVGMAAGCIPIVGYNIGAQRFDRAKELFTKLLIAEAIVGVVGFLIVELFPTQLLNVFGASNESVYYTEFGVKAFRIYLCMIIFACINKASFIFLQSLGRPWASTLLSLLREVVLGVGLAIILPSMYGLDGVLYSMPVADIITFVVSVVVIIQTYKMLGASEQLVLKTA
ncbi:MATE family efflux transporter [Breznakia pachnodae]|uniref:Multidrug export protein MepA n=1 Tax=Breznakia pachnodae TaxID=265178 RepID=A0ABU0DZG2_9FIRM|nr:MATE family efflux transporter [Breznakia pachnodae]MDQ0360024.1 Na+-driven multidrug efflux pump [Breznakia pachnodae]